jgi:hypothetical protein
MTGLEAAIAGAAIKETFGPAKALIAKFGRPQYEKLIVELCRCFQRHIDTSYERCKYVKNVLYRDNSVELKSQYVNVSFDRGGEVCTDENISKKIRNQGRILVSGTAGAGKTMFMKWLTLNLIENLQNHQRIPLFLELRYVTEESISKGFVQYILDGTSPSESRVSIDRFKVGLDLGQFILVLDAIDEVKPSIRERVLDEIRMYLRDFPRCPVLISSRPDDELESIQELEVYRTRNMNKDQAINVIEKLEFDSTVKYSLIEKLKNGLFEEHSEFLSNPLLATIMLLNFDHSADIPNKLTSFYRQAFEALYQRHDAAKGAYRRGHYAGLPLDEYEKVFSAFCFDSFLDSKVQFSDAELLDYFRAASAYYNISSRPSDLVQDAMKSVCVIQREGLDNVFAHRTFQEYFAALFLSRYREDDFVEQMQDTVMHWRNNNILRMLIELSPEPVEQDWLEPTLRKLVRSIRNVRVNNLSGARKIFKELYGSLEVAIDRGEIIGFSIDSSQPGSRLSSIGMAYNPPAMLTREIFGGEAIFTSLNDYIADNSLLEYPSDIYDRIDVNFDDEEGEPTLEINVADLSWLMDSGLPDRLGGVRDDLVKFYDGIVERIENRSTAMARLRTRHAPSSPVRRKKLS